MAHLGKCSSLLSTEKCPQSCENEREEPVCASDGNVYRLVFTDITAILEVILPNA